MWTGRKPPIVGHQQSTSTPKSLYQSLDDPRLANIPAKTKIAYRGGVRVEVGRREGSVARIGRNAVRLDEHAISVEEHTGVDDVEKLQSNANVNLERGHAGSCCIEEEAGRAKN